MVHCQTDAGWDSITRGMWCHHRALYQDNSPYTVLVVKSTGSTHTRGGLPLPPCGLYDHNALESFLSISAFFLNRDRAQTGWWFKADDVLLLACRAGSVTLLRELLRLSGDRRVNVNVQSGAAFYVACECGQVDVVRELLALTGDRRLNISSHQEEAFVRACEQGHIDVVRELLSLKGSRRVDVSNQAFIGACGYGRIDVMRELLTLKGKRRIDVHAKDDKAFLKACFYGHVDAVSLLLELQAGRRVGAETIGFGLLNACQQGHINVIKLLLSLDDNRKAALVWSPTRGQGGISELLSTSQFETCVEILQLAPCKFAPGEPVAYLEPSDEFDEDSHVFYAEVEAALKKCSAAAQHAELAAQLHQQVLLHSLHGVLHSHVADGFDEEASLNCLLIQYCSALAALPAAGCRPLLDTVACAYNRSQEKPSQSSLKSLAAQLCGSYRDMVWHGIHVPRTPIQLQQVDEPGLCGALARMGRSRMVLHRAGTKFQAKAQQPKAARRSKRLNPGR